MEQKQEVSEVSKAQKGLHVESAKMKYGSRFGDVDVHVEEKVVTFRVSSENLARRVREALGDGTVGKVLGGIINDVLEGFLDPQKKLPGRGAVE